MSRAGAPPVGLSKFGVKRLLHTVGGDKKQESNSVSAVSVGDSSTKTTRKTATTTMKKTTMTARANSEAGNDTMDPLSREDEVLGPGFKKKGVGLGDSLRSEGNIAKRGGRSVTPSIRGEEGKKDEKEKEKENKNKADGKVDKKKQKNTEGAEAAVTRKSTRVTAKATAGGVGGQAKSQKGNGEALVIDSDSDDNGKGMEKRVKKSNTSNENKASADPLRSLKVSAQENENKKANEKKKANENKANENGIGKGNGNGTGSKEITDKSSCDLDSDELSSGSDLGFSQSMEKTGTKRRLVERNVSGPNNATRNTIRSAASATTTATVGGKGQKSAGKSTNGSSKSGTQDTSKKPPIVVDELDCEKEDELYREKKMTPLPNNRRKPPANTYRTKSHKRVEVKKHMSERSTQEDNPSPKNKVNKAARVEFLDPSIYGINTPTPAPKPTGTLPKATFVNPLLRFNIPIESPDHLSNPKYINGNTNTSSSIEHIDLTQTPHSPTKKRRTTKSKKYVYDSECSALSSLSNSPASSPTIQPISFNIDDLDDLDEPSTLFLLDPKTCPICRDPFPATFLIHSPPPSKPNDIRIQLDRCRKHKRFSAEEFCREKAYPAMNIKWRDLPRRIKSHIPRLTEILERKRKSAYRDELSSESTAAAGGGGGRKRKLMDTNWQSHTPGYYGSRGAHIMLDVLMTKMADRIREVGSNDRVIASGGVSGFVQSVLVPELGVLLVMEDLCCGEEKAREVVKATVEVGELINDDDDEAEDEDEKGRDWFLDEDEDDDQDGEGRRGEWVAV